MISLVIPFVDNWGITSHCIETAIKNSHGYVELLLIDNGSERSYKKEAEALCNETNVTLFYIRNRKNTGVLATFKQGYANTTTDVICFIHSDVLLHSDDWDFTIQEAFEYDGNLGLAGLFGAIGVGNNGGRYRSQSNMLGLEWGKCDCHEQAWMHHSENMLNTAPATILDGVGMFFRRDALRDLVQSDMFDEWRALHHFYDRIMPLKLINKGWHIATIGIGFDHWSGATANSSANWSELAHKWCDDHGVPVTGNYDHDLYLEAERQFFKEFGNRIPCSVDINYNYTWQGVV